MSFVFDELVQGAPVVSRAEAIRAARDQGSRAGGRCATLGAAGQVVLDLEIADAARQLARDDFAQAELEEFSGDSVRDHLLPAWLGDIDQLWPTDALLQLGFLVSSARPAHLYATCSVDPHVDDMDGLSVCLVLHSDGFTFKQRGTRLKLRAGDWFIFDDRVAHSVVESKNSTSLLVLTAPLAEAAGVYVVKGSREEPY